MPEIVLWLIGAAFVLGLIYSIGLRGILLPHAYAERLRLRETFGRDPDPAELTRRQNIYMSLIVFAEAHPRLLGMDHYGDRNRSEVGSSDDAGGGYGGSDGGDSGC